MLRATFLHRSGRARRPRVAVLVSSYAESKSVTKDVDSEVYTPAHYCNDRNFPYRFTYHEITKSNAHQEVRRLCMDDKDPVHCFFNLVDGALEEDRAGVEVVRALQSFAAPFTGPLPENFEPNKVTMKLLVDKMGVKIPPFALVQKGQDIERKCRHLNFPCIVKHPSGYASVGITRESKCANMTELKKQVAKFITEHDVALVEEFITGREGTVLVCRDDRSKDGVRVFPPIIMEFPGGAEDFQSFDNKWVNNWTHDPTLKPRAFDINDPFYSKIVSLARRSYTAVMQNVGYGRVDFRLDERNGTNEAYFLEVNPNCGMFYPPSMGGDYADMMVQFDKDWDHSAFIKNQIEAAVRDAGRRKPWWRPTVDVTRNFVTKATETGRVGDRVFDSVADPSPVIFRMLLNKATGIPGCVAVRADDKSTVMAVKHSCRPNLGVLHGPTCELVVVRNLKRGDILTLDYSTTRCDFPAFDCKCGAVNCRGRVRPQKPRLRKAPLARSVRTKGRQHGGTPSKADAASEKAPLTVTNQ